MSEAKRRRFKPKQGDVFAVPLRDGTFGLGQVVDVDQWEGPFALFARRAASPAELLPGIQAALEHPLSILVLTANSLKNGEWPIIASLPRDHTRFTIPTDGKGASHTFGVAMDLLNAYHGLIPWDGMADPRRYEKLLIPGTPIPPTIRRTRDSATSPAAPPATVKLPQVTEGPAALTIQIVYAGTGLPSADLLHKRQEMERRLQAEGAGEVEGTESGAGVMEIYLLTDEVRRAVPLAETIAGELGFAGDMLIETAPLDEDEDEDDDA